MERQVTPAGSHDHSVGGLPRPAAALPQPRLPQPRRPQPRLLVAGVGFAALHVFGDQHLTMKDPHQMIGGLQPRPATGMYRATRYERVQWFAARRAGPLVFDFVSGRLIWLPYQAEPDVRHAGQRSRSM